MKFNVKINGHPGYLPAGTYQVKITHASKRTAKCSGNSQLELELEALGGEHEGKIARAWLTKARGTERLWQYFAKAVFPEATGASIAFGGLAPEARPELSDSELRRSQVRVGPRSWTAPGRVGARGPRGTCMLAIDRLPAQPPALR
jgi:hypothetical protein